MSTVIEKFIKDVSKLAPFLKEDSRTFLIVFSDDGDGLASAFLFTELIDHISGEYKLVSLDKAFPEAIRKIFKYSFDRYIFLDIGGAFYHFIPKNEFRSTVVIDHHSEVVKFPNEIRYINPFSYGFREEDSPVTSVIVYYIFKALTDNASKYAWIALTGLGEHPYQPTGLNWRVIYEGIKYGNIVKRGKSFSVHYKGLRREYRSLYKDLTLISSAGYFHEMPIELIALLKFGQEVSIKEASEKYRKMRVKAYQELTRLLEEEGIFAKDNVQWFEDYNRSFYEMGTRVFDSYVSYISHQARLYDKDKYLIGLSNRKQYIPGLGYLEKEWLNVAIRVSKKLELKIKYGRKPPASAIAEAAAFTVGGIGYGYLTKASCIIPMGMKDDFIDAINELAGGD